VHVSKFRRIEALWIWRERRGLGLPQVRLDGAVQVPPRALAPEAEQGPWVPLRALPELQALLQAAPPARRPR